MGERLLYFALVTCGVMGCSRDEEEAPVQHQPPMAQGAMPTGEAVAGVRRTSSVLIAFAARDNGSAIHGILSGSPPKDKEWISVEIAGENVGKLFAEDGLVADMADPRAGITVSQQYTDACNPLTNDLTPCIWPESLTSGSAGVTGTIRVRVTNGEAIESVDMNYEGTTDRYGPHGLRFKHGTTSDFAASIVENMQ